MTALPRLAFGHVGPVAEDVGEQTGDEADQEDRERTIAGLVAERQPCCEGDEHQVGGREREREHPVGVGEGRSAEGRFDQEHPHHEGGRERHDGRLDREVSLANRRSFGDHRDEAEGDEGPVRSTQQTGQTVERGRVPGAVGEGEHVRGGRHRTRAGDREPGDPVAVDPQPGALERGHGSEQGRDDQPPLCLVERHAAAPGIGRRCRDGSRHHHPDPCPLLHREHSSALRTVSLNSLGGGGGKFWASSRPSRLQEVVSGSRCREIRRVTPERHARMRTTPCRPHREPARPPSTSARPSSTLCAPTLTLRSRSRVGADLVLYQRARALAIPEVS